MKVIYIEISVRQAFWKIRNKPMFKHTIYVGNFALSEIYTPKKSNLTGLNRLICVAEKVLSSKCGINQKKKKHGSPTIKSRWTLNTEKKIKTTRAEIFISLELHKNNEIRSGNVKRKY